MFTSDLVLYTLFTLLLLHKLFAFSSHNWSDLQQEQILQLFSVPVSEPMFCLIFFEFVFRARCVVCIPRLFKGVSHLSANGTVKTTNVSLSQKWQLVSFQIGVKGSLAARLSAHFITFKGQSDDGLWSVWRCASIGLGLTSGGEKVFLKAKNWVWILYLDISWMEWESLMLYINLLLGWSRITSAQCSQD